MLEANLNSLHNSAQSSLTQDRLMLNTLNLNFEIMIKIEELKKKDWVM